MIPYNPCGAIVDFARFRYDTDCRFFKDSDVTTKIRWYPALPDAKCIPFPTVVNRQEWAYGDYDQPNLVARGEVFHAKKVINHMQPVPGADGSHICGTPQMFLEGATYDPSANFPLRPDGLPECCPGAVPKGVLWGGTARPMPDKGLVYGGRALELVLECSTSCFDVGTTHLGGFYTRLGIVRWPFYGPGPSVYAVVCDPSYPAQHISYESGPPGTVSVVAIRSASFCVLDHVIYSGPSDQPFELDCAITPTTFVAILVTASPGDFTVAIMTLSPIP